MATIDGAWAVPYNSRMTISQVLAEHLTMTGLTQDDAASALGTSQPTVNRWVLGANIPGAQYVPALAELTALTEEQIVAAIHQQRSQKQTVPQRVSVLEQKVDELIAQVEQILIDRGD